MKSRIFICGGGPIYRISDRKGKQWIFEFHEYLGPTVLTGKNYEVAKQQPGERSEFWPPFEAWEKGGKKTITGKGGHLFCVRNDARSRERC